MRIDEMPIWLILVATFIVVMLANELGYFLGKAVHRRSVDEKESPVSAIAGAILGLAAFMLAFTFGIVSERHAARKALVLDDANAIRTTWRRADLLPDPDRAETKQLLRKYIDLRVGFAQEGNLEPAHVKKVRGEVVQIQDRLWEIAVVNARKDMNSDIGALYVESLNEMNSINQTRIVLALQQRVPTEIWLVLYCITIFGIMGVGYQTGIAESKRSMARVILAVCFALVFAVTASLDRPDSGILKVPQQPLIDVQNEMSAERS